MIGWALRQVVIWGGLAIAIYFAIGNRSLWLPSTPAPRTASAPAGTAQQAPVPANTLVYRANPQGHVLLEAVVNGAPVRFMVDTGATAIALSARDAAAAGIVRSQLEFTGQARTASGSVKVAPVRLREVRLGQLAVEDVQAIVIDNLDTSLLGQSFLNRLQSYEMRDGVLTITWQ
jgi:aspartyl protease family protein